MPLGHVTITKKVASEFITWTFRIALMSIVSLATSYASKIEDVDKAVTKLTAQLPALETRLSTLEHYIFAGEALHRAQP